MCRVSFCSRIIGVPSRFSQRGGSSKSYTTFVILGSSAGVAYGQPRACTISCRSDASETIPFPGADSIFSIGCGAISGGSVARAELPPTETHRNSSTGVAHGQPRARVPHLVGSRPSKPYHFPAHSIFQAIDAISRHSCCPQRFAPRSRRDPAVGTNIEQRRNSGKKFVERLRSWFALSFAASDLRLQRGNALARPRWKSANIKLAWLLTCEDEDIGIPPPRGVLARWTRHPARAIMARREEQAMDVEAWLRGLGLQQYQAAFRDNEIDGAVLRDLTADDLRELGVASVGHRRKLLSAISELSAASDSVMATSSAQLPAPDAAERRQLTVMFCDLVGSTAMSARLDPEDMREVIGGYHRCCANCVEREGGFVAKYMGDGVLAYFGYPQAHEHDAERAVRAGLAIVEAAPTLATYYSRLFRLSAGPRTRCRARRASRARDRRGRAETRHRGRLAAARAGRDRDRDGRRRRSHRIGGGAGARRRRRDAEPRGAAASDRRTRHGRHRRGHAQASRQSVRAARPRRQGPQGHRRSGAGLGGAAAEFRGKPLRGVARERPHRSGRAGRRIRIAAAALVQGEERRGPGGAALW